MKSCITRSKFQAKEAAKEEDGVLATNYNVSMEDLPLPILVDVFSRLPIKTILQIKCVCKSWHSLCSDPYFAKIHLARAPFSIMILEKFCKRIYTNSLVPLFTLNQGDKERLSLLSSCNGLICLHEFSYKQDIISVCNPILGDHLVLPQLKRKNVATRIRGFGYNHCTNQYKVIQILSYKDQASISSSKPQVEVHTIGTNTWRNIGDLPYVLNQPYYGAFLNSALHWYAHSHDKRTAFMCSFDLGDEQFRQFPGPPTREYDKCRPINSISVGVSGGFLYLCDGFLEPNLDIWIMKKYGVKESWTKEFVIVNSVVSKLQRLYGSLQILNYRENMNKEATEGTELQMLFGSEALLAYNVRSKSIRRPKVFDVQTNYQAIPYIPSLVSIKKAAMNESSQML